MNMFPSTYIGRVRKPPGGETSDIFNLGPPKSYNSYIQPPVPATNVSEISVIDNEIGKEYVVSVTDEPRHNSETDAQEVSTKDAELEEDHADDANDENRFLLENMKIASEDKLPVKAIDEPSLKVHRHDHYNPITGQSCEVDGRPRLADCSNKVVTSGHDTFLKESCDFGLSRPSTRVRHPPGGASSITF